MGACSEGVDRDGAGAMWALPAGEGLRALAVSSMTIAGVLEGQDGNGACLE